MYGKAQHWDGMDAASLPLGQNNRCVQRTHKNTVVINVHNIKQEAQLPLRNCASAMHFFAATLLSIAVMTYVYHLRNLRPANLLRTQRINFSMRHRSGWTLSNFWMRSTPLPFHPNFRGVPLGLDCRCCVSEERRLVQPICPWYINVTDRQTDGRTTYDSNTALVLYVHLALKIHKMQGTLRSQLFMFILMQFKYTIDLKLRLCK